MQSVHQIDRKQRLIAVMYVSMLSCQLQDRSLNNTLHQIDIVCFVFCST